MLKRMYNANILNAHLEVMALATATNNFSLVKITHVFNLQMLIIKQHFGPNNCDLII